MDVANENVLSKNENNRIENNIFQTETAQLHFFLVNENSLLNMTVENKQPIWTNFTDNVICLALLAKFYVNLGRFLKTNWMQKWWSQIIYISNKLPIPNCCRKLIRIITKRFCFSLSYMQIISSWYAWYLITKASMQIKEENTKFISRCILHFNRAFGTT